MRDELAERLLAAVMNWDPAAVADVGANLQALAHHKYDRYGGFRPGEKFLESLAQWLDQFPSYSDRERALEFVLKRLVFITSSEFAHAIEVVYPDVLRPRLLDKVATQLGEPRHRVSRVAMSPQFRILQRRLLVLGLSDGSRLDLLRRACPELSHEQFWLTPELGEEAQKQMIEKLHEALNRFDAPDVPRTFVEVVLAEDFSGSGETLLRKGNGVEGWKGKLAKTYYELQKLIEKSCVDENAHVLLLLYVASAQAEERIRESLKSTGWSWDVHVIQPLPENIVVNDPYVISLCEWFYDPILEDQHKGRAPIGYAECALPLVLEHNTPNNSVSLLWADTSEDANSSLRRHALFPRYERHHKDRP